MKHADLIAALVVRYRHHLGKIEVCEAERERLRADLKHLRESIRVIDPNYKLGSVKAIRVYRKNPHFLMGESVRSGLTVMRLATRPMTTREIAEEIFRQRRILPNARAMKQLSHSLTMSLKRYKQRGLVTHDGVVPRHWSLTKP